MLWTITAIVQAVNNIVTRNTTQEVIRACDPVLDNCPHTSWTSSDSFGGTSNCLMSEWSGWAKCTAECEGALGSHTRNNLMKPMHGAESCNTVEE